MRRSNLLHLDASYRLGRISRYYKYRTTRTRSGQSHLSQHWVSDGGRSAELQLCAAQFLMIAQSWSSALRRHGPITDKIVEQNGWKVAANTLHAGSAQMTPSIFRGSLVSFPGGLN